MENLLYLTFLSLLVLFKNFFTKQEKDAHLYGVDVTYSVSLVPWYSVAADIPGRLLGYIYVLLLKRSGIIRALSLLYLNTEDYMDVHSFHHPANDMKGQVKSP